MYHKTEQQRSADQGPEAAGKPMKCLLIAPQRYPFITAIQAGLEAQGFEVKSVDFAHFFRPATNRFVRKFASLPRKIKATWEQPYTEKANRRYLSVFSEFKPDLVFIYNDQLILPELLEEMRKKARVAFMLGDNPLYTRTSNLYNLDVLFHADYIISPDTMWRDQLQRIGVKNVHFGCFGWSNDIYYPFEVPTAELEKYRSDLIYVGSANKSNWGYKRLLFLNLFKEFDLKAYISGDMQRWIDFFPGMEQKIIAHDRFDAAFNNLIYNCSKIAPVEQVPSLFNGIHVRVFDVLGAGILPLCEYSPDLMQMFSGIDIPMIKDYGEGAGLAQYWLEHDKERTEMVEKMRARVLSEHSPMMVIGRMKEEVFV